MSPENDRGRNPEPRWKWSGFSDRANRLVSDFIEDLQTPDVLTEPDFCQLKATDLMHQVSQLSSTLVIEFKGRSSIPYNHLANTFLARAVVIGSMDKELSKNLFELSEELRSLSKKPSEPKKSLVDPKITLEQMQDYLNEHA